jgi:hypothetical protein
MNSENAVINIEIGMYGYSEEYFFDYKEKQGIFDPVFLQGLAFADYILKVYLETKDSVHGETFSNFLYSLKAGDIEVLKKEKREIQQFNKDEASLDDIRFIFEINYSNKKHSFFFEATGNWVEEDLFKMDMVNSVFELISLLGQRNLYDENYSLFLQEIANNIGKYLKEDNSFDEIAIPEITFMVVVIAYENYLNIV